jgi:prevent-host-death family protein
MQIPVSEAKGQLTELVRRAEAGDEIVLTRHGRPVVRLEPVSAPPLDESARRKIIDDIAAIGALKAASGSGAERSQDFLYDESGLPK